MCNVERTLAILKFYAVIEGRGLVPGLGQASTDMSAIGASLSFEDRVEGRRGYLVTTHCSFVFPWKYTRWTSRQEGSGMRSVPPFKSHAGYNIEVDVIFIYVK